MFDNEADRVNEEDTYQEAGVKTVAPAIGRGWDMLLLPLIEITPIGISEASKSTNTVYVIVSA